MSQSTTNGGSRHCRSRRARSMRWPPARSDPLSVRRRSMRGPRMRWTIAPRRYFETVDGEPGDGLAGLRLLGNCHLLEILAAQDFHPRMRESRIEVERARLLLAPALAFHLVEHRFGQTAEARLLRFLVGRTRDLLEHQLHQLLEHLRLLPEDMECLVENLLVLASLDEDSMQCPIEVHARPQRPRLRRVQRIDHMAGTDRQPRFAQHARKMHDVESQAP